MTTEIYNNTKKSHQLVDQHAFVKEILKNNTAFGNEYVCMIENILYTLEQHFLTHNMPHFFYTHLKKSPSFTPNTNIDTLLKHIDTQDYIMYLCQIYMWYLSLLSGGKLLKKHLPESTHYLFDFPPDTKTLLKKFINQEFSQLKNTTFKEKVIPNINQTYVHIVQHFNQYIHPL